MVIEESLLTCSALLTLRLHFQGRNDGGVWYLKDRVMENGSCFEECIIRNSVLDTGFHYNNSILAIETSYSIQ